MPEEKKKTALEKVLEEHPTAFADDNGQWVRIRVGGTETVICRECGQHAIRPKPPLACRALGGAGSEAMAWENAAKSLGLM
ncbi:MAG: hypothetical protein WC657_03175 [Candidatus Paceibacterota bacterium]|jgi:hypothetical protein